MTVTAPWERRVHFSIEVGQIIALVVAVVVDLVGNGPDAQSLIAMAVATIYVIISSAAPNEWYHARFGAETFTLLGAFLTVVAITLTGGASSPYLLLSMGPPIFATLYGGIRSGLMTGLLSAGLLALVTLSQGQLLIDAAPAMALYLVFVLLVGVIRKLLEDIHQQAVELAIEKEFATQRLESLEEIHGILVRLSQDVSAGRLNAVEVGAETLDTILTRLPGSAGKLAIEGESGLVVLAARGVPDPEGHVNEIPITTADSSVGMMELVTPEPLADSDRLAVEAYLRPLGIAFANLQLLQDIAGSAVAEERLRLAREMHDDIGPSLASLGLALDLAGMQMARDPEMVADLKVLRSNVTKLVEDVRAKVADLRSTPGPTLTARVLQASSGYNGSGPQIVVDIDERRPPRPALIGDLTSIVTEAMRNAQIHSGASTILISGQIHRDWGNCQVRDDGMGFDPEYEPDGHFGLLGMRERAEKLGATIDFDSEAGRGTTVTIEWGSR
jgi:signal transduction histidine kinase